MSIHGILGEQTRVLSNLSIAQKTLYPIARSMGRDAIGWQDDKLTLGVDWWGQAFEISS